MVMYPMICAVAIELLYLHVQNMGGQVSYYSLHDRRLYHTYHLFVVGVVIIYGHVSNDLCCGNRIIILFVFKIWVDKYHIILSMIEDYTIHITFL